jgi:hypothetical protein
MHTYASGRSFVQFWPLLSDFEHWPPARTPGAGLPCFFGRTFSRLRKNSTESKVSSRWKDKFLRQGTALAVPQYAENDLALAPEVLLLVGARLDSVKKRRALGPATVYPVSRQFRQAADSRVAAPWPVVAGSFGLHASEGWCYHCPVSHPIPVTNQATQSSRPGGIFFEVPTLLPCALAHFAAASPKTAKNDRILSNFTKNQCQSSPEGTAENHIRPAQPLSSLSKLQGDLYAKKQSQRPHQSPFLYRKEPLRPAPQSKKTEALARLRRSELLRRSASRIANALKPPKQSNFIELYPKPAPIQSRRDG